MNVSETGLEVPCLFAAEQIAHRIGELARQISADHAGKELLVVGVLKGAFVFMADLVRRLTVPVRCDFVKVSSYGMSKTSSGEVRLLLDLSLPVEGQHVLLVEDIVDTGTCGAWLLGHLRRQRPASLRLCALLDKQSRRQTPVTIDYLGFSIPDHFIVGYGIDCAERYRQLPYIGYLPSGESSDDDPRRL
jgi:hypoxanthine phosphoribosyltransferase